MSSAIVPASSPNNSARLSTRLASLAVGVKVDASGTSARRWPNTIIVNRPEEAEAVVERIQAAGSVCVKAYEDLSPEKLRALREATAKRGMAMPGHVPYGLD
jgi:hypothetical protein